MDVTTTKNKSTVTIKTFQKWSFSSDFNAEVDEHGDIISLTCKICYDNLAEIRKEARSHGYKGIVSGIESYADGTVTYVHKRGSCAR